MELSTTTEIIADIRAGRMVILVDEEDRENEGDLVIAADRVTAESINFMAKHGRGLICLTVTEARCKQLNLPLMVSENRSPLGTNFTLSIEAASGVTTGISAADRARTIQAAVAKHAKPEDIVQPGHIFPLKAQRGGVLVRAGHTEAGCDLAQLAGLEPAAVICEILKEDGEMARLPDLMEFASHHGLKLGTIADLIEYRSHNETVVSKVAEQNLTTPYGTFRLVVFVDTTVNHTHLALVRGDISRENETLVRVHEPVSVFDFLEVEANQHSFTLTDALKKIANAERAVMVMLHRPESGSDLLNRIRPAASARKPSERWDPRSYGIGAQILRELNVGKMRLMARPKKMPSLTGFGLEITGYESPDTE
jgi:3,4-dihydroxy 2-butanone 4-phosphate synthase / GTP cyclohydrolase II